MVIFVWTSLRSIFSSTMFNQYSPVWPSSSVSKSLIFPSCYLYFDLPFGSFNTRHDSRKYSPEYKQNVKKTMTYNLFHGNGLYGKVNKKANTWIYLKTIGYRREPIKNRGKMFVTLTSAMCLEHLKNFFSRSNKKSCL